MEGANSTSVAGGESHGVVNSSLLALLSCLLTSGQPGPASERDTATIPDGTTYRGQEGGVIQQLVAIKAATAHQIAFFLAIIILLLLIFVSVRSSSSDKSDWNLFHPQVLIVFLFVIDQLSAQRSNTNIFLNVEMIRS
jgi:hypothetical protein